MTIGGIPAAHFAWIAASVFLLGLTKGGLPVGPLALPILVLAWPDQSAAARQAVGFMLPLLCVMDVFAVAVWRKSIRWRRITPLIPGAAVGVAAAAFVFLYAGIFGTGASDRVLKFLIGSIGIAFVALRFRNRRGGFASRAAENTSPEGSRPPPARTAAIGLVAGVTSTVAHAAGPLAQMYFLTLRLSKNEFAATLAGFFFLLNLIKVPPYIAFGMIRIENLRFGAMLLPLAPLGVLAGSFIVRRMRSGVYLAFVYVLLFGASVLLIARSLL